LTRCPGLALARDGADRQSRLVVSYIQAANFGRVRQELGRYRRSNNSALTTLATAVQKAGLADTLNNAEAITVFARSQRCLCQTPKATLSNLLLSDKDALTKVLTYHVAKERRTPADPSSGSLPTLQGGTLTTKQTADMYAVKEAQSMCGNVQTRNATVYLRRAHLQPLSPRKIGAR
jgi:uncharacterized surface protein with fasciclin (FAS1) repeats